MTTTELLHRTIYAASLARLEGFENTYFSLIKIAESLTDQQVDLEEIVAAQAVAPHLENSSLKVI
ncbi:hypothetical protein [uncultured Tateyamaria sp.]|uniref:hypothetical protein n=1 Tax=uncultured Tateyamaria sp. TaxID=455651 RepID=UPI002609516D|nr:hypothetical protein [uncultured Tateyamaria sp.]